MSADGDFSQELRQTVLNARERGTPLQIEGSGSKAFYGGRARGEPLPVLQHQGVINYLPRELVVTARTGTPLDHLQQVLGEMGQMLPFEPPGFGPGATLGGTIACGFSGPRRPYTGAARDFVLGSRIINGEGQILRFGGEVMKNVAGYDLSRLMTGALGTLGLILEVSFKVLPIPEQELTLVQELPEEEAILTMNRWAAKPLPLSGASYDGLNLHLRLSGSEQGVNAARRTLGGDVLSDGGGYWQALKELKLPFFDSDHPLWRLSVPPTTAPIGLPGKAYIDWGGGQRWLLSEAAGEEIRHTISQIGGHATLFRGGDRETEVFQSLPPMLQRLHRSLKLAFDPAGILNPGRLYSDL